MEEGTVSAQEEQNHFVEIADLFLPPQSKIGATPRHRQWHTLMVIEAAAGPAELGLRDAVKNV